MEINIDSESATVMLSIMFGMMIFLIIIFAIIYVIAAKVNERKPLQCAHAVLVEKPQDTGGIPIVIAMTFQLDNGSRVRLSVPASQKLVVGDRGQLTWQGTAFRSFVRDSRQY